MRSNRAVIAATPPPVEATPAISQAVLAKHAGHIDSSQKDNYADWALCRKGGGSSALGPQLAGTGTLSIRKYTLN